MAGHVTYSLIVTHRHRMMYTLNKLLSRTGLAHTELNPHNIGNWSVWKIVFDKSDKVKPIHISNLYAGHQAKIGGTSLSTNDKDDDAWDVFITNTSGGRYIFYIVTSGISNHMNPSYSSMENNVLNFFSGKRDSRLSRDFKKKKLDGITKKDEMVYDIIKIIKNDINSDTDGESKKISHLFISDLVRGSETLKYILDKNQLDISDDIKDIYVLPCAHEINYPEGKMSNLVRTQSRQNIYDPSRKEPFRCHRKYRINWSKYNEFYKSGTPRSNYILSKEEYNRCNSASMFEEALQIIKRHKPPITSGGFGRRKKTRKRRMNRTHKRSNKSRKKK